MKLGVTLNMATIVERKRKDGSTGYLAQITRRGYMKSESRTFSKRKDAERWADKREGEIDSDIEAGRKVETRSAKRRTLGDAIDRYIKEDRRGMGDTKAQVLRTIREEYDISKIPCDQITSTDISKFAEELWDRPKVNSPATVNNYLQHLSGVFSVARPMWGFALDEIAMRDAMKALGRLGVRGKAEERNRRPTLEEIDKLMAHFHRSSAHDSRAVPMHIITAFGIFSTRRQGEICRITWSDYEPDEGSNETRILVRDLKHPGDKKGNDTWCTLPDPCRDIISAWSRDNRNSERIFPFHSDTISKRFTDACGFLGIENLRFHDLRHEGTSRLFEMDWNIPRVANATGHRSWNSLKRYEHIRTKGDMYDGWKWLAKVT